MFKLKIFRYFVIAIAVVVTSGAVLSGSTSMSPIANSQSQAKSETQAQLSNPDKLSELPTPEKLAERPHSPDLPSGRMLKQLNLSPEQLQKLKTIRDRAPNRMRELAQQSRQANKELRDLLVSTESSDAIRAKHTQVLSLQQELQKQHFERMLSMREILTPQQRSQLNEIMQKNRSNHPKDHVQNRMEKRIEKRMEYFRDRQSL